MNIKNIKTTKDIIIVITVLLFFSNPFARLTAPINTNMGTAAVIPLKAALT